MKIIHTADLHLDSALNANLTGDKKRTRQIEVLDSFKRLVNYATQNDVQAILIAGDFFDVKKITHKTKTFVYDVMAKNPNVMFYYLCGNHDENVLAQTDVQLPTNLVLFGDKLQTFDIGNGVTVSGVELTKTNASTAYQNITLPSDKINILVLHGQTEGTGYEKINLKALQNKGIAYLALGHYHTYQTGELDKNGIYAYSGCLDGRGFDETGEKGFVLLTIKEGKLTHEFVPFSTRKLHIVEVNITGCDTHLLQEEAVFKALTAISGDDLIRVVLTGKTKLDQRVDVAHLQTVLCKQYFFVEVQKKTKLDIKPEDYMNDISLKGEFVRQVLNSQMEPSLKEQVLDAGIAALLNEEVVL